MICVSRIQAVERRFTIPDFMQQQIRDTEHIGELLLLNAVNGFAVLFGIRSIPHLLLQCLQPADQKAAGTAGKVGCRDNCDTT